MPTIPSLAPHWATSSLGNPADISALERTALSDHLAHCGAQRGRLQVLWSGADELQGILAGRVITSAVVLALLFGGSWLML